MKSPPGAVGGQHLDFAYRVGLTRRDRRRGRDTRRRCLRTGCARNQRRGSGGRAGGGCAFQKVATIHGRLLWHRLFSPPRPSPPPLPSPLLPRWGFLYARKHRHSPYAPAGVGVRFFGLGGKAGAPGPDPQQLDVSVCHRVGRGRFLLALGARGAPPGPDVFSNSAHAPSPALPPSPSAGRLHVFLPVCEYLRFPVTEVRYFVAQTPCSSQGQRSAARRVLIERTRFMANDDRDYQAVDRQRFRFHRDHGRHGVFLPPVRMHGRALRRLARRADGVIHRRSGAEGTSRGEREARIAGGCRLKLKSTCGCPR